jgi:hypothetical protein
MMAPTSCSSPRQVLATPVRPIDLDDDGADLAKDENRIGSYVSAATTAAALTISIPPTSRTPSGTVVYPFVVLKHAGGQENVILVGP